MNDRYLYRAKRTDNGEWVEGDLVHSVYKINDICVGKYGSEVGMHQVDPSTICQCTGLKDKNGKLIWENDIVCGKMYLDHGQCGENVEDKRKVEWREGYAKFDLCSYMKLDKYEVIGNIFDNPQLLEVVE